MASETEIANIALSKIGEQTLLDLSDDHKAARLCNLKYPEIRDALLRGSMWGFAIKRVELALSSTTPLYEYDYAYALPSDCLRILDPDTSYSMYKVEGDYILTNIVNMYLRYIQAITDPNKMDAIFRETLASRLARDLAIPLADSRPLYKLMHTEYMTNLSEARFIGACEEFPDRIVSDQFLEARFAGTSGPEGFYRIK